ncbi:hypothetical protein [Alkaliphilus crotonatoxidans]
MRGLEEREQERPIILYRVKQIILWILSLFFWLSAYGHLFVLREYVEIRSRLIQTGLLFVIIGILLNPLLSQYLKGRFALYPTGKVKAILLVILLTIVYLLLPGSLDII